MHGKKYTPERERGDGKSLKHREEGHRSHGGLTMTAFFLSLWRVRNKGRERRNLVLGGLIFLFLFPRLLAHGLI